MNRLLFVLPLFAVGCYETDYSYEDEYFSGYEYEWSYEEQGQILPVEGAMAGDMAGNGEFERDITRGTAWKTDDGILQLEVHALGDAWAMFGATLDLNELEPGVSHTYQGDQVDSIGCSGPVEYEYDFDGPADQVTVSVDDVELEVEGSIQLTISADFPDGAFVTAVVVVPPDFTE